MQKSVRNIFSVNTEQNVLSSECQIYKTEHFIKDTRRLMGADFLISKIAEGIINNLHNIQQNKTDTYFKVETIDRQHTFLFTFGHHTNKNTKLNEKDIIFFRYLDKDNLKRRNDQRFILFAKTNKIFDIIVTSQNDKISSNDFKKLYSLSHSDGVNFPLLNEQQKKIVNIEDQNVLVQGVAGSGKTNICISKIIFVACREYTGKLLYTTYSRGLLLDTKDKIASFRNNLETFVSDYEQNSLVFTDKNHKKAIENKLGIYFVASEVDKIIQKIKRIILFLDTKVDYMLPEDLYTKHTGKEVKIADERYFTKIYIKNIKNHQLAGKLRIVSNLSYEVIFKEIYGMILGCYDLDSPSPIMSLTDYTNKRKDSFTKKECEIIHSIALDYTKHLKRNNLTDKNIISRKLLDVSYEFPTYSLTIIDEVQDMTEVNLCLLKTISRKVFCVGDALQMINPSYFSYAYLKRLLFEKDVVNVAELSHNYRNTKKIVQIIEELGKLNVTKFGTHSFVLKGLSIDSDVKTSTIFVKDNDFMNAVAHQNFDNFTIIVSSTKEKEALRKKLKRQEILTVSEIKGLERNTVILYNILSSNLDKWQTLERTLINRKYADENSVYRYYFNLFYVGVSRAQSNLYVAEEKDIPMFTDFFANNFDNMNKDETLSHLSDIVSTIETDIDELLDNIEQFIKLQQYDNARFAANKILDDVERTYQLNTIDIYEQFIHHEKHRDAGIRYWELGLFNEAKQQFARSGDDKLIELVDACLIDDSKELGIDILQYYDEVANNESARNLILQVVKNDLNNLTNEQKTINKKLKSIKEKIYGAK